MHKVLQINQSFTKAAKHKQGAAEGEAQLNHIH